jgi:hypothetical protein
VETGRGARPICEPDDRVSSDADEGDRIGVRPFTARISCSTKRFDGAPEGIRGGSPSVSEVSEGSVPAILNPEYAGCVRPCLEEAAHRVFQPLSEEIRAECWKQLVPASSLDTVSRKDRLGQSLTEQRQSGHGDGNARRV